MQALYVIKIGGNIIDTEDRLTAFLASFAAVEGAKILVHGGGKVATETGTRLGIEPNYHNGRRITDTATLELVTMVYGGLINKKIVAQLQSLQANAIGLTGCDGNIIKAVKRPVKDVDFGFAGDVTSDGVNTVVLGQLLESGLIPVLAPLTHDGNGTMLNTNADTIAQETAKAFAATHQVKLIYCFEKRGVLSNAQDDSCVISNINEQTFKELVDDGTISDGMIPKLDNAFRAISHGVNKVIIGSADNLAALISGQCGTHIQ
jgi:acetylglutamate kinase